ncbi:hypothetical protein ACOTHJ_14865 [Achromobacter xylosoxidans]
MPASPFADVVAGSWVARFRSLHDERPELGQVRDAYDGNLNIERFAPDGRCLGRHLALAAGAGSDSAQEWEPIDPPDFQSLALVFAYGKLLTRRRNSRTQASLALIRSNCHRPVA